MLARAGKAWERGYLDVAVQFCEISAHHRALSDIDKDGRLTAEEFVIAMHLMEKAKAGVVIPKTLPPELKPRPGLVKFSTVDVPRKASVDRQSADRQRKGSLESPASFEDRRKENFEAGRMELDRRRKSLMEQQEKEAVSL